MTNAELLQFYRNKFKHSLIGKWTSVEGTFQMMLDVFNFTEDGKGTWLSASGSGEEVVNFYWREKAPFIIEIREDNKANWTEVKYDFKEIENDVSKRIILCQNNTDTFYFATTRIGYSNK